MASKKATCQICCEDVASGKIMCCPTCPLEACHSCVVTYLTTMNGDANCMGCKKVWDRAFLYRVLPAHLMGTKLKEHRAEQLFEREKAMLPMAQNVAAMYHTRNDIRKQMDTLLEEEKVLKQRLSDIKKQLEPHRHTIRTIDGDIYMLENGAATDAVPEAAPTKKIVCACPAPECRGFVFSDTHTCQLCKGKLCERCHQPDAEGHTCDKDDLATVKHLKSFCKNCPTCFAPSQKMDGCSQVFCMQCQTTWNWSTGEVDKGMIHTPDYFAYMRRMHGGQVPPGNHLGGNGDANGACGPDRMRMRILLNAFPNNVQIRQDQFPAIITNEVKAWLINRHRVTGELYYVREMQFYPPVNNMDLRVKYLLGEIDEAKWKKLLHMREKEYFKFIDMERLKQAYHDGMVDWMIHFMREIKLVKDVKQTLQGMTNFHNLMMAEYKSLSKRYNSKAQCPLLAETERATVRVT